VADSNIVNMLVIRHHDVVKVACGSVVVGNFLVPGIFWMFCPFNLRIGSCSWSWAKSVAISVLHRFVGFCRVGIKIALGVLGV